MDVTEDFSHLSICRSVFGSPGQGLEGSLHGLEERFRFGHLLASGGGLEDEHGVAGLPSKLKSVRDGLVGRIVLIDANKLLNQSEQALRQARELIRCLSEFSCVGEDGAFHRQRVDVEEAGCPFNGFHRRPSVAALDRHVLSFAAENPEGREIILTLRRLSHEELRQFLAIGGTLLGVLVLEQVLNRFLGVLLPSSLGNRGPLSDIHGVGRRRRG